MASPRSAKPPSSWLTDALLFAAGAVVATVLLLALANPFAHPDAYYAGAAALHAGSPDAAGAGAGHGRTFYDDPAVVYTVDRRRRWRVLMVSGSQPAPCGAPGGDHTLLRLLKNKADYCRLHGVQLLYNKALLRPSMHRYRVSDTFQIHIHDIAHA